MNSLPFALDSSESAHASVRETYLGYVGLVRFAVGTSSGTSVGHECLRYRDTQMHWRAAEVLVARWRDERLRLGDV